MRSEVPHRQLRGIWSNFQSSANARSNMVAIVLMSTLILAYFFTPGRFSIEPDDGWNCSQALRNYPGALDIVVVLKEVISFLTSGEDNV